jgi:mono/diheme cytochrome c family protein
VRGAVAAVLALAALGYSPAAIPAATPAGTGGSWYPHPADATWAYQWSDTVYAPTPTTELVTVASSSGSTFQLAWTTAGLNNPDNAISSQGTADFQETDSGLVNTNWSSTLPPPQFPVLCSQAANCSNSLSSVIYNVIWGSRAPVLEEPLVRGFTWTSTGGAASDVSSTSSYLGQQKVTVPAFPAPVTAAVVRTQITQAGAIGDPYGSGVRTVWWVYGVGPVKVEFDHAGGGSAPITTAVLETTNQTPASPPDDLDYFPFRQNRTLTFSWTNSKYMTVPEVEMFTVDTVVNNSARFTVASVTGPIKVAGNYGFTTRASGITNLWGTTSSATLAKFPALGPSGQPKSKRIRFITPFDLMDFGFNPILTAYPTVGESWGSTRPSADFTTFGVTGESSIVGERTVRVPAGSFRALEVRSTLKQPGFPFGSGTRTSWFAANVGLVKLVFRHADGSVSTAELLKIGTAPPAKTTSTPAGNAKAGETVFRSAGCGTCHAFAPAGATGKTGPNLADLASYAAKAGKPLSQFVSDAITNPPAAYVPPGYPKSGMPAWGSSLSAKQLADLVAFLTKKR